MILIIKEMGINGKGMKGKLFALLLLLMALERVSPNPENSTTEEPTQTLNLSLDMEPGNRSLSLQGLPVAAIHKSDFSQNENGSLRINGNSKSDLEYGDAKLTYSTPYSLTHVKRSNLQDKTPHSFIKLQKDHNKKFLHFLKSTDKLRKNFLKNKKKKDLATSETTNDGVRKFGTGIDHLNPPGVSVNTLNAFKRLKQEEPQDASIENFDEGIIPLRGFVRRPNFPVNPTSNAFGNPTSNAFGNPTSNTFGNPTSNAVGNPNFLLPSNNLPNAVHFFQRNPGLIVANLNALPLPALDRRTTSVVSPFGTNPIYLPQQGRNFIVSPIVLRTPFQSIPAQIITPSGLGVLPHHQLHQNGQDSKTTNANGVTNQNRGNSFVPNLNRGNTFVRNSNRGNTFVPSIHPLLDPNLSGRSINGGVAIESSHPSLNRYGDKSYMYYSSPINNYDFPLA